jgi:acetylornithine deacetylase/succinyl-diaminopimelate desuccinylase-like protein
VFEPSSPFQRFEQLSDTTARGPGIIDMKGGDVIIVQALEALKQAGTLDRMSITVVMNGDEEHPGEPLSVARRALTDASNGAAAAIGFEGGDGDPRTADIARRGASSWTLRTTGTPAHSSQIFREDVGPGALFEAARVLEAFRVRLAGQPYLTFTPGVALGGTAVALEAPQNQGSASGKTNVVAKEMVVQGDLRTLSPEQLAAVKAVMREIVARSLPHTTSGIEFEDGYPPMAPHRGEPPAARALRRREPRPRPGDGGGPVEGGRGRRLLRRRARPHGARRHRARRAGRPHRRGDRGSAHAAGADQARRGPDLPPEPGRGAGSARGASATVLGRQLGRPVHRRAPANRRCLPWGRHGRDRPAITYPGELPSRPKD